jgi:AraC-like DNA-binding protein
VDMIFNLFHSFALRVQNGGGLSRRSVLSVQRPVVGMAAAALEESMSATPRFVSGVKDYIDGHLHDPALTVASIAAALHVSERTLYRLFAAEANDAEAMKDRTVASYIRSARLRGARRDLDAAGGGTNIRDVACRWGFTDSGYFAKLFRNEFGSMPSEYVGRR